jgi:hypothetical protein
MTEPEPTDHRATIYGHDMALTEPPGVVTDVIVIARSVRVDDAGNSIGDVVISHTRQTDAVLLAGLRDRFHFWLEDYLDPDD